MIGPQPCAYARVYRNPVFTSQSYDIIISTSTRRTNLSVFLVLMLGYRCASACAYALVKTRLKACQATSSDGKRCRGLCKPNRLSFNYCLVDNSEIQIKLIERRNDFDLVRQNLNRCVVMESIVSE